MQGHNRPIKGDRKLKSYWRICKRCDDYFRASARGCNICINCDRSFGSKHWTKNINKMEVKKKC